jgi:hypothetical protein
MTKEFDWSTVEVIETTPALFKGGTTKPFAILDLTEAAEAATALTTAAQMFVWIWIVHRTKKRNSQPVAVSNIALAPYGISGKVKAAALDHLETAGLISIERPEGKAPVVRLLRCKS